MDIVKSRRGRPPKFGRPSRPITVTLPEDIVERLTGIDPDLGRAIVSAVERRPRVRTRAKGSAELESYGNQAVIVVTPVKALKRLAGVQLVPIGGGRALISLDSSHSTSKLELDIRDTLDQEHVTATERQTLETIAAILRRVRLSRDMKLSERTIIVLETKRHRRSRRESARDGQSAVPKVRHRIGAG